MFPFSFSKRSSVYGDLTTSVTYIPDRNRQMFCNTFAVHIGSNEFWSRKNFYLFIYLFIYSIFEDVFNSSDYVAPNERMIVNNELERICKEAIVA
jgi:hypothetical protein